MVQQKDYWIRTEYGIFPSNITELPGDPASHCVSIYDNQTDWLKAIDRINARRQKLGTPPVFGLVRVSYVYDWIPLEDYLVDQHRENRRYNR